MMSRARAAVGEWFESVTPLGTPFEQIDVDQLGEHTDWSRPDVFAWSIELFEALCAKVREARSKESALLVVPLAYSATLDPVEPSAVGLLATEWTELEVPGLYLFQDQDILGWDATEEYRCVLTSMPVAAVSMAYYRSWRTAPSEFARALYFVRHPERSAPA